MFRKLKDKVNNLLLTHYLGIFICIFPPIFTLPEWFDDDDTLTTREFIILPIMGITGFLAQMFSSRSFMLEKANIISIIN